MSKEDTFLRRNVTLFDKIALKKDAPKDGEEGNL